MSIDNESSSIDNESSSCEHNEPKPPVTYERITIALPTPPGVKPLPPSIFFDVDNRFNAEQKLRIRTSIVATIGLWRQHYEETAVSGTSQWAACSKKYAKKNLRPVWLREDVKIPNGEVALEVAMDVLTKLFADNGNKKSPIAKIRYRIPPNGKQSTIFGKQSYSPFSSLSVTINPLAFGMPSLTERNLTGSLIHAWLHRSGYTHPRNIYTTYFIGEAAMCVMRAFQDKVPGQPDSVYTQFFD